MAITMLVILVLLSCLAFWTVSANMLRVSVLLFMVLAGVTLMSGLKYYDLYVDDAAMGISLMLVAYSFACIGMAYGSLLKGQEEG